MEPLNLYVQSLRRSRAGNLLGGIAGESGRVWLGTLLRTSVVGSLIFGGIVIVAPPKAYAQCPLPQTVDEPPYGSSPLLPSDLTDDALAIPNVPVKLKVSGSEYSICAVYMSIDDSTQLVTSPPLTGQGYNYPDLRIQPWFSKGSNDANTFAEQLYKTGSWTYGGNTYNFSAAGDGLLVNDQLQNNPNISNPTSYFLWKDPSDSTTADGKAAQVFLFKPDSSQEEWMANNADNLVKSQKYWFWVLDPLPNGVSDVPGPLPLFGAGAAYGWSRRLRKRIRQVG